MPAVHFKIVGTVETKDLKSCVTTNQVNWQQVSGMKRYKKSTPQRELVHHSVKDSVIKNYVSLSSITKQNVPKKKHSLHQEKNLYPRNVAASQDRSGSSGLWATLHFSKKTDMILSRRWLNRVREGSMSTSRQIKPRNAVTLMRWSGKLCCRLMNDNF